MCKNYDSRKRSLVTTLVVLAVCLVIVTGSTFSLFTSNSKVNIAVTSGAVDVDAIIDTNSLKLWSLGQDKPVSGGSFANGGSSAFIDTEGTLNLKNIVPGDNALVTIDVTNKSNVAVAYRVILTISGPLAEALDIEINTPAGAFNYGYTSWINVGPEEEIGDITVKVSFPNGDEEHDNKYQGLGCSINMVLEAVQGNADVVNPITHNATTGVYEINSEEGMMLMNNIINTVSHGEGRPLKFALTADMDMTGYDWTPVALLFVDVDGQGHTISNLNCGTDDWGRSGFAGYAGGANISNVTFENVAAVGTQAGIIAGAIEGNCVSNVTIKGANSVKYDYAINPKETWGGAGVIAGVASYLNPASTIVIDGATVNVDYNGLVTSAPVQDEYAFISDISGVVTNNGAVTTTGTPIVLEQGLQMIYGENGEKTLYLVPADYAQDTLTIPEGVTAIGNYAFAYNNNVKTVKLASTVRDLGRGFDSSAVEKVVLNEGLTTISARAFKGTTALKEVAISSTVTTIADNAFQKSGIKTITIPANVKTVGEAAFGSSALETVTFEGNTNIEGYAFRGCSNLRTVNLNGSDVNFVKSTLNGRNSCWFCNGESNNPNTSNITFYVKTNVIKERVLTAMGAERNNTPVNVEMTNENGYDVDEKGIAHVYTAEALKAALADGKDVVMACDITVAATAGGYSVAGIVVNGQTLDGNGHTLTVTGANSTWACGIYITGGTVKNLVVKGAFRGIFTAGSSFDIYLNNVSFQNVVYTFSSDNGNGQNGVYATDCTFNGWTSYSNVYEEVVFTDCTFTEGSGYAFCRPYNATKFVDCTFTEGYKLDTSKVSGLVFENCYYGETAITADNALTLKSDEVVLFYNGLNNVVINGQKIVTANTLSAVMAAAKGGNIIIDAQGANLGDYYYDGTFGNGTVLRNAKFTYAYGVSVDGVVTFENCEFVSDHSYSANFSDGSYTGKVIFNNCVFDGWSSFGDTITSVEMNECTFKKSYNYGILRFYQNAVLENCEFEASFEGIDSNKTGTVVEFKECNGIEGKIFNNGSVVGKWIVDGVELDNVTSW